MVDDDATRTEQRAGPERGEPASPGAGTGPATRSGGTRAGGAGAETITPGQRNEFVDLGVKGTVAAGAAAALGRFITYVDAAGNISVGGHFTWWGTFVAALLLLGMAGVSSEESPLVRTGFVAGALLLLLLIPGSFAAVNPI